MDSIARRIGGKKQTYHVFSKEEADERAMTYIHWSQATKARQWIISDDDYVCIVIKVNGPYQGHRLQLVLPYCRKWMDKMDLLYEAFRGKGDYSDTIPGTWLDRELRTKRAKRVIRLYAMILLKKGRVTRDDQIKLATLYRPDQKEPIATFKRLLKQPKTKSMIEKQLEQLLLDQEVTPTSVIEEYKDVMQKSKDAEHFNVTKSVIDRFAEMFGMIGKKNTPSQKELPDGGESEIFGLMERTEEFIEVPDDEGFIDDITSAKAKDYAKR